MSIIKGMHAAQCQVIFQCLFSKIERKFYFVKGNIFPKLTHCRIFQTRRMGARNYFKSKLRHYPGLRSLDVCRKKD